MDSKIELAKIELTLEAKHAIRTYLLKLVTLPALGIAVLPFLFSYFAKDIAQSKAAFEVGKEANVQLSLVTQKLYEDINEFTKKTTEDRLIAEQELEKTKNLYTITQQTLTQTMELQKETSDAVRIVDKLRDEAKKIRASLDLQKDFVKSDDLVRDVTNALAENQPFAELVEQNVSAKIDLPVGTILPSLAPPNIFLKGERDKVWRPADGRQISPASLYAKLTGKLQTPDFRGMFLRGLNAFQDGVVRKDEKQDPDGAQRKPGDYQEDALQGHKHSSRKRIDAEGGNIFGWGGGQIGGEGEYMLDNIMVGYADDGHGIPRIGKETRPKNVAVYFYIKIN
jgi:hypothetical protein